MDGIPSDTYVEKGMLKDISGILDKIEEEDGILDNIREGTCAGGRKPVCYAGEIWNSHASGTGRGCNCCYRPCIHGRYSGKYQSEYSQMHMPMSLLVGGADTFYQTVCRS